MDNVFTNIYRVIVGIKEDINDNNFIGRIYKRRYKKKIYRSIKKIDRLPLNILILDNFILFCSITKIFDYIIEDNSRKVTIPETEYYGPVHIRFNIDDAKIIMESYSKTSKVKNTYLRYTKNYSYEIEPDNDTKDIIPYIKSAIRQAVMNYARKELE